jgi:hypothetical protein
VVRIINEPTAAATILLLTSSSAHSTVLMCTCNRCCYLQA